MSISKTPLPAAVTRLVGPAAQSVPLHLEAQLNIAEGLLAREIMCVPGSELLILGMVIPPLIGNPYNGYINHYDWVDDHPLLCGNNGSLDLSTCEFMFHVDSVDTFFSASR